MCARAATAQVCVNIRNMKRIMGYEMDKARPGNDAGGGSDG